jgi:arsenate reductase
MDLKNKSLTEDDYKKYGTLHVFERVGRFIIKDKITLATQQNMLQVRRWYNV